jgi:pilus assembly protein CpaC
VKRFLTRISAVAVSLVMAWAPLPAQQAGSGPESPNSLFVASGKSALISSRELIERVSVGFGDVAEATAVSPREVLVNAKKPGSTSLIVWQRNGEKLFYDVNVTPNRFLTDTRLDALRREIAKELPGQTIALTTDNDVFYLRGTVKDLTSVERAMAIVSSVGKAVNLLYVAVPTPDPQILLKVRFASLDRNRSDQLGVNLFSTGATNTIGSTTTQQYPGPTLPQNPSPLNATNPFALTDLLNIFLFRKDINLGAIIKDLEIKGVVQVLAEPNVLAQNGKQASFLAGGEFPYPVFQGTTGGTGGGAITIQFREFGVRLNFIPTITPRGTVRLQVAPEVSALDYVNALTIQGFTVPGLNTRKVKTDVELEEGQTFAIGGLLDRRVTDTFQKMPFISDIPIIGKLFESKNVNRQNTELVVIVTPELVRPIPAGGHVPDIKFPQKFLEPTDPNAMRTPGIAATGPVPVNPPEKTIPAEQLIQSIQHEKQLDVSSTSSVYANGGGHVQSQQQPDTVFNEPQGAMPSVPKE